VIAGITPNNVMDLTARRCGMAQNKNREEEKMKKGIMATVFTLAAVMILSVTVAMATDIAPGFTGTAYIAGHGGHLAVLDLSNGDLSRIVITGAGGELEGQIAGLSLDPEHKSSGGGTHGAAMIGRNLYVGLLNGKVMKYNLDTEELTDLGQVGKKFCGAVPGPDGNVYYEDMADGNVYDFSPSKEKTADVIPVGKAVCGIGWGKDNKKAFVSDMVMGKVFVLDWAGNKRVIDVINNVGTFIHQLRQTPDHSEIWVTAANEFKDLQPYAVAGKGKSEVVIIDTDKDEITSRIDLTAEGAFAHDLAFTPDGKYALVTARTYSNDSILLTIDTKTHEVMKETSLCLPCHENAGVKVTIDQGSPLLCGITVDWKKK
jgi:hypothetical protein